jgi:hypothetical protein
LKEVTNGFCSILLYNKIFNQKNEDVNLLFLFAFSLIIYLKKGGRKATAHKVRVKLYFRAL